MNDDQQSKFMLFKESLEALPDAIAQIIKAINQQVMPEMMRLSRWFRSAGFNVTYDHPATKHTGRRRSRREMRDIRQQAHFIHLADTIRKDGEQ
jgi:hypothetical protein